MPSWLRSALTTFVVTFIGLVPLTALVGGDTSWATSAAVSALLAAVRTVVASLDPNNTSFGIGSTPTIPELDAPQADPPVEG